MKIENYELLELIAQDDERETFTAIDDSTAKGVFFHKLRPAAGSNPGRTDLSKLVKSLIASGRADELLFAAEREGNLCIVTPGRSEYRNVRQWLETRLNATPSPRQETNQPPPVPPAQEPPPALAAPPTAPDPGDFTKYFQAPPVTIPVTPPEAPAKAPSSASDAGDFTRMFNLKGADAPVSESDFMKAFGTSPAEPRLTPTVSPPQPTTPAPPTADPGEFTKLFGLKAPTLPSSGSTDAPKTVAPKVTVDEFARVINTPAIKERPAEPAPVAQPVPERPKAVTPPVQASPEKPSYIPLVLILGGLFLAAVILILYFVLKRT